jgi:hypothetical protein
MEKIKNMKIQKKLLAWCLLLILASVALQSCGDDFGTPNNGNNNGVTVNNKDEAKFKGKIYFTIDYNLYSLDGSHNLVQLTHDMEVHDPAVSPDGKNVAFIVRYKYHSDLVYRSTDPNNSAVHTVVTGAGKYTPEVGDGENNYFWFSQPAWSADGKNLLFLSDLQKNYYWCCGKLASALYDSNFLDLQVFSLPASAENLTGKDALKQVTAMGYANWGTGGNRDPSYRPGHDNQIVYTHYDYHYEGSNASDLVQIFIVDGQNMIDYENLYKPADGDPALPLTPDDPKERPAQPAFAPDGNTLAFVKTNINSMERTLNLMKLPSDEVIADKTARYQKSDEILNQGLVGYKNAKELLKGDYLSSPTWSADGTQMIYYAYKDDGFEIWLVNLQTDAQSGGYSIKGEPVQLTKTSNGHINTESRPVWVG